ncbi:MAG: SH3 domain-containing protein [Caldilineaceae bacterium]|nr:SH3 domain-containing protein [Caldilineaceae bacterium]
MLSDRRRMLRHRPPITLGRALLAVLMVAFFMGPVAHGQSEESTLATGQVAVVRLNMRSEPTIGADVITRLPEGEVVTIVATSADGHWYQVETDDGLDGWLYAAYVEIAAEGSDPAAAPDIVTLAVTPTVAPTVISLLPTATPVPVAAAQQGAAAEKSGDPDDEAAETVSALTSSDTGTPNASTVPARMNVRSGPGTVYPVVDTVPAQTSFEIIGLNPGGDWYQVRMPDSEEPGWLYVSLTVVSGSLDGVARLEAADLPPAPEPAREQTAASTAAAAPAAPVVAANSSTGFGYGITANMWQGDKQGVANLVRQLGFSWVKQQIRWEYAEPAPGAVQWQEMDDIVNTMNGNGINLMFSVVTSPPWSRPNLGGTGGPPEDFQLFANFVGAIAGRYCGRLQAIEVWNEQNLRREWEGFPLEPASYMDLLKRSYNAIKGSCPQMLVISGATTPAGYSDVAFDDIDYLRGMYQNGLKAYSDGIGIHPSGFANPPSVTYEDWAAGNYDALSHVNHRSFYFLSTLRASRRVMEEFGDTNKRLWPTEFGWGSTPSPFPGYEYEARIDEATQARWIVEAFNIMAGSGYVAVPMLWNLNYPRDTEMGAFAVVGRPAFDALRQMTGR